MSVGSIGYWEYLGGKFKGWEGIEVYDLWGKKYVHGCTYPTGKYPGGSTVLGVYTPEEFEELDKKAKKLAEEAEKKRLEELKKEEEEEAERERWLQEAAEVAKQMLPEGFEISKKGEVFDPYGNFWFVLPQNRMNLDDLKAEILSRINAFLEGE